MQLRALLLAAMVGSTLAVAPPAHAGCAAPSSRYLSGTVRGEDGYDVNVHLGFALVSATGVPIGMDGCRNTGYSAILKLNAGLGYAGAPHSAATTYSWRLSNLPSNASVVWIESWPRGADGKPNYHKYGGSMRRKVPVNTSGVRVRLPKTCAFGGTVGKIWGRAYDRYGKPVTISSIHAWSEAPDSQTAIMGFGPGRAYNGNYYYVSTLASNQPYVIWADAPGYRTKRVYQIPVKACASIFVTVRFD